MMQRERYRRRLTVCVSSWPSRSAAVASGDNASTFSALSGASRNRRTASRAWRLFVSRLRSAFRPFESCLTLSFPSPPLSLSLLSALHLYQGRVTVIISSGNCQSLAERCAENKAYFAGDKIVARRVTLTVT